jgi:hypothetical protein
MRIVAYLVLTLFVGLSLQAAPQSTQSAHSNDPGNTPAAKSEEPAGTTPAKKAEKDPVFLELHELRTIIESQSEELHELRNRLTTVEAQLAAAKGAAGPGAVSGGASVSATSSADKGVPTTAAAASVPTVDSSADTAEPIAHGSLAQAPTQEPEKAPIFFRIGLAKFTPGGFLDFTGVFRSTNAGSELPTSFGAIPFNNSTAGHLTETRLSAQYSRLSLKVDVPLPKSSSLTAYVETDFLGYQPPNVLQTTSGFSPRLRLFWADIHHGKWEVLGGQSWSLMTPNRSGLSPLPSDVFYTLNEDPNFQVGLIWARQAQLRVVYHPDEHWAFGASLENPQQFAPSSVVFPSASFTTQFDNGSSSTSAASAASNPAVPNLFPDVVVKGAYDGHPGGHAVHIEAAGLVRSFRVFNTLATPADTNTIVGGGGSLNLNFEAVHNFRLIANSFYGDGGGRYIFGLGPDVIVKPDGTLSAVHSGSGLGGFEYQATPHYMFYGYYGGAYFQRNFGLLPAAPTSSCDGFTSFTCVGFGFPGSETSANRAVQESTFGIIPTLWSNENWGKLQIISQYSYVVRSPWFVGTGPKNAHTSMVYLDLRYTLP